MDDSVRAVIEGLQREISSVVRAQSQYRADKSKHESNIRKKETEKTEIEQMITAVERGKIRDGNCSGTITNCKG